MSDNNTIDINKPFDGLPFMTNIFLPARRVVALSRPWHYKLQLDHKLQPAIPDMICNLNYRPRDWQQLLLEWPHVSQSAPTRLAYTRDERDGLANRQLITTLGKYLHRHFDAPDHVIRDMVAMHTVSASACSIVNTLPEIIDAARNGPHSCMSWRDSPGVRCSDGQTRHPYAVYIPEYGWHMAVRKDDCGDIVGRCLCNTDDDGSKYYVRSYKYVESGYSQADEQLEAWLKSQGYGKSSAWHDGAKLAFIETGDDFLAPYIDGSVQRVDVHIRNGDKWLEISDDGEYECDNTSGEPSCTARSTCDCCGDRFHDDDMYLVGRDDEEQVCTGCHDNAYTYVLGRRRRAYHISSADAVYIDSQSCYYDVNYLGENNIVELSNGDYEHADNAVHIESTNEWYASDDSDVCYDEYNERHELVDNCVNTEDMGYVHANDTWQCCATDKYYSDSVDYVEIDGELYHPDHAPVVEESEDNIKE